MKLRFKKFLKFRYIRKSFGVIIWFGLGALLALIFVTSSAFLLFEKANENKIYPGIVVNGINLGGKTKEEARDIFLRRNNIASTTQLVFTSGKNAIATLSAKDLNLGFDADLIATQAYLIGRSGNFLTDTYLSAKALAKGVYLPSSFRYSEDILKKALLEFIKNVEKKPVDALFTFENGKVTAFRASSDGNEVDLTELDKRVKEEIPQILVSNPQQIQIEIPQKTIKPSITTENTNRYGIKELIGVGRSTFYHSIPNRVYNIALASARINGTLVKPGETFSFAKTLGDVSSYTGYQQAYIIQNGKTILGDGGGVCQVSTTFFRAILDAGLPIAERHAHSYRVGYYEQDSPPGIDATVYVPSVDLKFTNDTGNYILIQAVADTANYSLTFYLYGTKDSRTVKMTPPVVTNQTPPPPDLYQDDPTIPKGQIKQVDFAAWGANVYFTREVDKDGKVLYFDKFVSNYQPWQAVYLRGTKE